ncbi:hypothetical protein BcepSauron_071 [Burkholderia phage BcepSauron]|uniref:Uncharacterized protein n=1 Tax=Burkholderia phage BcepSauron TaxID=2530033 RepID=A0A482MK89_9CAUD|nr:hypothetical protein H1O17_gp071 [Burkholderia phage BcepSauron]QBQ74451.1 hypothetical protein BcepSauron_071 [Burkholderia phage BcepSauron]
MNVIIHDQDFLDYPIMVVDTELLENTLDPETTAFERAQEALARTEVVLLVKPEHIGRVLSKVHKHVTAVHNTVQLEGDTEARLQRALASVGLDLHSSTY